MKKKIAGLLACPSCRGALELDAREESGGRVLEGTLRCTPCDAAYPVRGGIPRFVDVDRYADTFSFEWRVFREVQIDARDSSDESENSFRARTGWDPGCLRGKLVLDAGVGAGRYAEVASRWGAEVVGVDLSFSVEAARQNLEGRPNVTLVQADIFRLPFRGETFDAVYSLGVLHHTPDTRKAFERLVPLLRSGGEMAVFLYAYGHYSYFSDIWRKITTRLPHRLVYCLSALAVPLYPLYRLPFLGLALRFLFPMSQHPKWRWRWLDTYDWYTPRYQHKHTWLEVYDWFREAGFGDIRLLQESREMSLLNINMRGRKEPARGGRQ